MNCKKIQKRSKRRRERIQPKGKMEWGDKETRGKRKIKTEEEEENKRKEKIITQRLLFLSSSCLIGSEKPYSKNLSSLTVQGCDTVFPKHG
jgi:hypothetical protein